MNRSLYVLPARRAATRETASSFAAQDDYYVSFPLEADGHRIPTFFDSGALETTINLPAARLMGLRKSDPRVHLLPPDSTNTYWDVESQKAYTVTGVTIVAAGRPFPISPIVVSQHIPSPDPTSPEMDIGLNAFRDRLLWISYSTRQVCWSDPMPPHTRSTRLSHPRVSGQGSGAREVNG